MKTTCYLILGRRGITRMTKRLPSLTPSEVAIKVTLSADYRIFNRFLPAVELEISDQNIQQPPAAIIQLEEVND